MAEELLTGEQIRAAGYNPDTQSSIGGKFYLSQFTGGGGGATGGDTIQRAIQLQQQAAQPAVQSLQASIPEIQKSVSTRQQQLQAEVDPLKQRYQSLLDEIKGNQQTAENRQTVVTSNELGKRGIVGSSTLAGQEIANAVNPITREYTGLYNQTGLQREADLRDLANQITNLGLSGTEQQRAVANAIAQLQAGASAQAISQGIQQEQFNKEQEAAQAARDLAIKQYNEVTLPESKANIQNIYSTIANRGATTSGGAAETAALDKIFGTKTVAPTQETSSISRLFDSIYGVK